MRKAERRAWEAWWAWGVVGSRSGSREMSWVGVSRPSRSLWYKINVLGVGLSPLTWRSWFAETLLMGPL